MFTLDDPMSKRAFCTFPYTKVIFAHHYDYTYIKVLLETLQFEIN